MLDSYQLSSICVYVDLSFDTRAFDKELNADVSLDLFGNNSMSVKFHVSVILTCLFY